MSSKKQSKKLIGGKKVKARSKINTKLNAKKHVKKQAKKPVAKKYAKLVKVKAKATVKFKQPRKLKVKKLEVKKQEIAKQEAKIEKKIVPIKEQKLETSISITPRSFEKGVKVVYPAHGVGEIIGVETHLIAGTELKQYVIQFEKEKMVLRVPVARAEKSGLRLLSTDDDLKDVRRTLLERPKSSRGMWSRRAKEYETKINSGNIISVAEVVRDLHKNVDDPERSYSERVIYENALERLSREVSAIKSLDIPGASDYLVKIINDNNPYFIRKAQLKKAAQEAEEMEDDSPIAA